MDIDQFSQIPKNSHLSKDRNLLARNPIFRQMMIVPKEMTLGLVLQNLERYLKRQELKDVVLLI